MYWYYIGICIGIGSSINSIRIRIFLRIRIRIRIGSTCSINGISSRIFALVVHVVLTALVRTALWGAVTKHGALRQRVA